MVLENGVRIPFFIAVGNSHEVHEEEVTLSGAKPLTEGVKVKFRFLAPSAGIAELAKR